MKRRVLGNSGVKIDCNLIKTPYMLLSYSGDGHRLITLNESTISKELSNTRDCTLERGQEFRYHQLDQYSSNDFTVPSLPRTFTCL